jgi:tetratricopeptide (TPR) repeat protein
MKNPKLLLIPSIVFFAFSTMAQDAYHYFNKGVGQMAYENYADAIQFFSKAIEIKSDYANALANRGVCFHRLKQYEKALTDYQKTESITKGLSSYNMACAYSLLGKTDEAFQWLTLCQKSEYKQSKAYLEADTDFENIRSDKRWKIIIETDWYTPYEKAMQEVMVKWNAGDMPGAIEQLTKAISLDPSKVNTYRDRGFVYAKQQNWVKANADFDKMIQLDSKSWEAYAQKAAAMDKQRNYAEALPLYQKAMDLNPEYKPYPDLAMVKFALGQKKEAISDLKNNIEFYPKDDFSIYFCGLISYQLQEDANALAYANQAIKLNSQQPDYHLLKANIHLATKDFNTAIEEYGIVLSMNEKSGEAYYKRAIAKAERFAKNGNKQDKIDFCADMEKAEGLNYEGAAQYLRELCN